MNTAYLTHEEYLRGLYTANNLTAIEKELMGRLTAACDEIHEFTEYVGVLRDIIKRNELDYALEKHGDHS